MDNRKLLGLALAGSALAALMIKPGSKTPGVKFIAPVHGAITGAAAHFGYRINPVTNEPQFHNGVDIHAVMRTPVVGIADGIVDNVFSDERGGLQIIIKHDNGYKSGYAHLDSSKVKKGDRIIQGRIFAYTGESGKVTGPHLHFTLTNAQGNKIDPQDMINFS